MEPRYQARSSEEGVLYQGEAFPLDQSLIRQADAGKSKTYNELIQQHKKATRKRKLDFYSDFMTVMAGLLLGSLLLAFILKRKDR